MGLLDHQNLMIIKGVGKTPGDTASAEVDPVVLDLWSPGSAFSLADWSPNIPSLKSGGTWADSPITDGRTLISGVNTNVIETMVVNLTGANLPDYTAQFAKLQQMVQDARDFWDEFGQIEPVYILWWASCAPGPQFSLIYNIDMDVEFKDSPVGQARITLTIEREYRWRAEVPPGGNPKQWTYFANGQRSQWKATNANLITGTDHLLVYTSLVNKAEILAASAGYLTQNFVDIPAASIPGDLPALVNLTVAPTGTSVAPTSLLIGKTTKKTTGNPSRTTGINQLNMLTFNAADGGVDTDTTIAADAGASRVAGGGAARRSQTTFVTATMQNRMHWGTNQYTNGIDASVMRGRYAVFLRARVSAAATCSIQLQISQNGGVGTVVLAPVTFSDLGGGGVGASTDWGILYLGQIAIPMNKRQDVSANGRGTAVDIAGGATLEFTVRAARTSGAGSLYMNDLIFLPIDEGSVRISASLIVAQNAQFWNYDNTGYYLHGQPGDLGNVVNTNAIESDISEFATAGLTLTPNVSNRLLFVEFVDSTKRSAPFDPSLATVRVNIVPCWSGIRSV